VVGTVKHTPEGPHRRIQPLATWEKADRLVEQASGYPYFQTSKVMGVWILSQNFTESYGCLNFFAWVTHYPAPERKQY